MRYSNILFSKGSIVFCKYPANSDRAFLNGRPLIVISNPTNIIRTLIVCTTGTKDKPGIKASFYNHMDRVYVGGAEESTIYPWSVYTIHADHIASMIGQLDPFIMHEVENAVDFHLGRNATVPGYLREHVDAITSVEYALVQEKYMAPESVNRDFYGAIPYRKEYRQSLNSVEEPTVVKQSAHAPVEVVKNDTITDWAYDLTAWEINIPKICKDPSMLKSSMDTQSVNFIVSRIVPISLICKRYRCSRPVANALRITLSEMVTQIAKDIINTGINPFGTIDNVPDFVIIGMVLLKTFSENEIVGDIGPYSTQIDQVQSKYKINTEDRRIWKAIDSFIG